MHEEFDDTLTELVEKSGVGQEVIGEVLARTLLRSPAAVTRADIAKGNENASRAFERRAIPPGTLSKVMTALSGYGLLEERGVKTEGGRWLGQVCLGSTRVIAGVHVHRRKTQLVEVTTAVLHLDGTPVSPPVTEKVREWKRLPAVVLKQIAALMENPGGAAPDSGADSDDQAPGLQLFGIGIEVATPVWNGAVLELTGEQIDLGGLFRAELSGDSRFDPSLPVLIENDLDAWAVLAAVESHTTHSHLVVVAVLDESVGAGLIMDGRLRRGGEGRSMEIGHLQVGFPPGQGPPPAGVGFDAPCLCGRYGHVDTIATPSRIREQLDIADLHDAAGKRAASAIRRAGAALGRAVSHICNVVNPSQLIIYVPAALSASFSSPGGAYLQAAEAEIDQAFNAPAQYDVRALPDDPKDIALLGAKAAAVCVLQSFVEHALRIDGCQSTRRTAARATASA
ncbi:ROK family protein [Mycobacterium sp. HUMS_1102779]|uniref:ROK family protein n=1 Tax=Mycobacterium sp. HUMS_1102779 TaxID=3383487 RepID=UPI00389A98E0